MGVLSGSESPSAWTDLRLWWVPSAQDAAAEGSRDRISDCTSLGRERHVDAASPSHERLRAAGTNLRPHFCRRDPEPAAMDAMRTTVCSAGGLQRSRSVPPRAQKAKDRCEIEIDSKRRRRFPEDLLVNWTMSGRTFLERHSMTQTTQDTYMAQVQRFSRWTRRLFLR